MKLFSRLLGKSEAPTAHRDGPEAMFTEAHRACDEAWAAVEQAVDAGDTDAAVQAFHRFDAATRLHLAMEEEVLFPALEGAGFPVPGPTSVMREEHTQMRALLDNMLYAAMHRDLGALVDDGDTLLMITQQHNEKEEGMLYPAADSMLGQDWEALQARLDAMVPGA